MMSLRHHQAPTLVDHWSIVVERIQGGVGGLKKEKFKLGQGEESMMKDINYIFIYLKTLKKLTPAALVEGDSFHHENPKERKPLVKPNR